MRSKIPADPLLLLAITRDHEAGKEKEKEATSAVQMEEDTETAEETDIGKETATEIGLKVQTETENVTGLERGTGTRTEVEVEILITTVTASAKDRGETKMMLQDGRGGEAGAEVEAERVKEEKMDATEEGMMSVATDDVMTGTSAQIHHQ